MARTPTGPVRAVLLDALGTLLDLEPPAPRLQAEFRGRFGIDLEPAVAEVAMGAEIAHYRATMLRGRDTAGVAALRRECAAVLLDAIGPAAAAVGPTEAEGALLAALRFHPFPEARAALAAMRAAGLRLVVASNWDVSLDATLAAAGLRDAVDAVVTSAQAGAAKPAPALFAAALRAAQTQPGVAVHAGDRLVEDVHGAAAAGIRPVLVDRSGRAAAPAGVPVVADLDGLASLVGVGAP